LNDNKATIDARLSAEAIERNELIALPACPFQLPDPDDMEFLLAQETVHFGHKDISFDPARGRLSGYREHLRAARGRLKQILGRFSESVAAWLSAALPEYEAGLTKDRVTLRTQEEATRALRLTARNDLLHIDNFPTRPTFGRRILRVYVNINPVEPQIWAISERFPELLGRFAPGHRLPRRSANEWMAPTQSMLRLFTGPKAGRSAYDALMLRLHHFLKENEAFQSQATRRVCTFAPGTAWLLFSDGLAHAQLRGRFVLEHSFFVSPESLVQPAEWPVGIVAAMTNMPTRRVG
jgi:hypothetical protein